MSDARRRRLAGLALLTALAGCRGGGASAAEQLRCQLKAIDSPDAERREVAVEGLGRLGAQAVRGVPKLAALLAAPSTTVEVQQAVLATLAQIGPGAVEAVPAIVRAVSQRSELEPVARVTLALIGPKAGERVVAMLGSAARWQLRREAARLAAGLEATSAEKIDKGLLAALLRDAQGEVREAAAMGLGERRVASASWALGRALSDKNWGVAVAAAKALANLGAGGRKLLGEAVDSKRPATSLAGALVLEPLPSTAVSAVSTWLEAIDDPRWAVRAAVARAVGKLGAAGAAARKALNRLLTDSAIEVQEAAEDALARLGQD